MVISNGDLHLLVSYIRITMTQEHHLLWFSANFRLNSNLWCAHNIWWIIEQKRSKLFYLIVVSEVVVRNCDGSWSHDSINEPISTGRKRIMVNPNMTWPKNGNAITISHCPPSIMTWWASNHGIARWLAVVNVQTMNNDVGYELDRNTSSISNVYISTTAINCLETVHDEFLL